MARTQAKVRHPRTVPEERPPDPRPPPVQAVADQHAGGWVPWARGRPEPGRRPRLTVSSPEVLIVERSSGAPSAETAKVPAMARRVFGADVGGGTGRVPLRRVGFRRPMVEPGRPF